MEDNKEINHHGKKIEVGKTDAEESPKIINVKGFVAFLTGIVLSISPFQGCTTCRHV